VRSLALIVLVVTLLGGTAAAFAVTEVLKLERSPITAPRFTKHFSPVCGCPKEVARLSLRLRKADTVDAAIVDSGGNTVRTLIEDERYPRGPVSLEWDGRADSGAPVVDGRYRLRIRLEDQHRTIVLPNAIFVDTETPRARVIGAGPQVFSPDDDGARDRVHISYSASEPARGTLLVDGVSARTGKLRAEGRASMRWDGTVLGRALGPGLYALALRVEDRAGNVSEPTEAVPVRLRYVDLVSGLIRVRRGGMLGFKVDTDAETIDWQLVRRRGSRPLVFVSGARPGNISSRLPPSIRPGFYLLRVIAAGHADQGAVRVLPRS
jgi:flagellar hook assembly protein FlgD